MSVSRTDIFDKLAEFRPSASLDWTNANTLYVGKYVDGMGLYHSEFVLNFRNQDDRYADFSDLHFGTRFYFKSSPTLVWINEQNLVLRFTKLALDKDGVVATADLFGPSEVMDLHTFTATYVLYDQALLIVKAMSKN